jgi:hypothetical protein
VYFVAHGVLAGANAAGSEPVTGLNNLYVYRSAEGGGSGHVSFITTLSPSDEALWHKQGGVGIANVTPDGRYLVFTSHRALTPDVSRHEAPGQPPPPSQVYRYDAQTESITRISIGENGFNDNGNAGEANARIVAAFTSFGNGDGPSSSNPTISGNGNLVFFESPTGLTPDALNDATVIGNPKVLAQNVYEWEAFGTQPSANAPTCANPVGCVSLISDGHDRLEGTDQHENESAVELLGTDESGTNVFFWTADPVLKRDTDSQVDLYDARVGGGFEEPEGTPPCGTLEECHAPPPAGPVSGSLGSVVFSGAGNLLQPVIPRSKPVTTQPSRAQELAKALRVCRRGSRKKRTACEARARKKFGAKPKSKAKRKKKSSRRSK